MNVMSMIIHKVVMFIDIEIIYLSVMYTYYIYSVNVIKLATVDIICINITDCIIILE